MTTPTIKDIRAAAAARRARRVRNRRLFIGAGAALLVIGLLSWWVVPVVVRGQLEQRGREALARAVTVEKVAFNPLGLVLTIDGLQVAETDGGKWIGWDRLRVNLRLWSLVRGRLGFDAIELDGFDARVAVDGAGRLNFADLLTGGGTGTAAADAAPAQPTAIEIGSLVVKDARIDFSDASRATPFATTLGPVSFTLEGFHTVGDPNAPYDFVATTEAGERLSWNGQLSATPLRSEGTLELSGVQLAKYAPYTAEFTAAQFRSGTLDVRVDYAVAMRETGLDLNLSEGQLTLAGLAMAGPGAAEPALTASTIDVSGLTLDWAAQTLQVGAVAWNGGAVRLVRDAGGIDLVRLLAPEPGAAESSTSAAPGLEVRLGKVTVDQVAATWRDETLARPAVVNLARISVAVDELNLNDLAAAVRIGATVELADGGGTVQVAGEAGLAPFRPALEVRMDAVAVEVAAAYLQDAARMVVTDGALTVAGSLGSANDDLVFRGDVGVAGLQLFNPAGARLAAWENLRIDGVSAVASAPFALEVQDVRWVRPDLAVEIGADGSLNWAGAAAAEAAEPAVTVATPAPVLRVNRVELVEARIDFKDGSLVLPAGAVLTDLSGTMTGLSSVELGKGKADLRGKANGSAAVAITGDFNPLGRPAFTDLQVKFDRVDLSPLGGYIGHYAGYALQGGRVSVDIDFKLQDRRINSETVVTLDDFTLGRRVQSPDATKLPVGLALKLLRDVNGQIVIDLPVQGSLDDPEFRVGRVVWRVITNLLTKAATAPFAMLGALVGGGGAAQDLDQQTFSPASAELSPAAQAKLGQLAQALAARPALQLTLQGQYAPEADAAAWRPIVLENRLRERAVAGQWTAEAGWATGARERQLIAQYVDVFGEPPVDPAATLAAVTEAAVARGDTLAATPGPTAPAPAADETLLGLLRRWLGGGRAEGEPASPAGSATVEPVVATPTSAPAPVLALLPAAEIEARLLAAVEIEPSQLQELARARAAAVRSQLEAAGVAANRLAVSEPVAGDALVKFELR